MSIESGKSVFSNGVVHLVDDEAAVRDSLGFLLESRGLMVRTFDSGEALLAWLDAPGHKPVQPRGCFILDIRMNGMSGLELHQCLREREVATPVLFLSGHGDIPMAVEALKAGAFDFLEKPYSDNTLVDRIESAMKIDAARHAVNARDAERQARLASLTPREREVMERVATGRLNKIIADELGIAVRTVEVTRARVFSKLAVKSAAEMATLIALHK
jgi:two-component system response regulator DctR